MFECAANIKNIIAKLPETVKDKLLDMFEPTKNELFKENISVDNKINSK